MEQTKTIKELLEMPYHEVKEYLLTLPSEERRRISGELLQAIIVRDLQQEEDNSDNPATK